jgi:hypothetical protein
MLRRARCSVAARNRLTQAIVGAAMSGMTKDEIVDLTGYPADLVLRICRDAGISGDWDPPRRDTDTRGQRDAR